MNLKVLQLRIAMVCFVVLVVSANNLFAQQLTTQAANSLIKRNAAAIGLSKTDMQNLRISSAYFDELTGTSLVYAQQTYKGIDVFNVIQTYAFKNGRLVSAFGNRITGIDNKANMKNGKADLTPADAVKATTAHLSLVAPASLALLKQESGIQKFDFGDLNISSVNVRSQLIWLLDETGTTATLTWQVEIQPKGISDYWLVNIDASRGTVISKINLNLNCKWGDPKLTGNHENNFVGTVVGDDDGAEDIAAINTAKYRVIPFPAESPYHPGGTPSLETNPWELAGTNNNATTLKWNSNGATDFDSTRGNNVLAQEDANGNNGLGMGAHSSEPLPDLVFNYKPKFDKEPTIPVNRKFAITNLFYWNNIMHDIAYQYGFNEKAGNFQANNLGRGGAANDFVLADAQDGSGTNNANFATPVDGTSPRMQMFLWSAVPNLTVIKPAGFAGLKTSTESDFSTGNKLTDKGPVQGRVILFNDNGAGTSHEGCSAAANATQLNGKVALIDRGTCSFTIKAKNAQNAGAIGVIVADNIPGEYPTIMGGTDNTITTPAVMVSFETGDTMKQKLQSGNLVVNMAEGVKIDGDIDNGVIAHEYTHGISNRLTGGPNNVSCLQNREQMGEGWSDYMALMVTTNWTTEILKDSSKSRPIGTYAFGQQPDGPGIRFYPYSIKLGVNPWTYDSLKLSSKFSNSLFQYDPHVVGEVWCNMLWTMTWAITKQVGTINKNIYDATGGGGNTLALRLVMGGMRLQPCSPGFVDGRNAILKADTILYGGAHSAAIWKAFASRGLGYKASQGSSGNLKDGVADYSLPPSPIAKAAIEQDAVAQNIALVTIAPNPANKKVTLTISGNKRSLTVDLVNAAGQQLKRFNMRDEMLNINLPKLASGMYYLRITGEGFAESRKLIIQ